MTLDDLETAISSNFLFFIFYFFLEFRIADLGGNNERIDE